METFEGKFARISYEIELNGDASGPVTVQLLIQTEAEDDEDQGRDARLTCARIENKNSMKFEDTNYLDEMEKKLDIAIKKGFTLNQLFQLIDQEIKD